MRFKNRICATGIICGSASLVLGSILLFPRLIVDQDLGVRITTLNADQLAAAINSVRETLLQAIGGIVLAAGAFVTWRQLRFSRMQLSLAQEQADESKRKSDQQIALAREQMKQTHDAAQHELHLTREAQITERFTRAIDQLGSTSLDVRLGGIYGLERIARDSPSELETVGDILAAYIRQHSPWPPMREGQWPEATPLDQIPELRMRSADVQAALSALGRGAASGKVVDLSDVDLRRADLSHSQLQCALFSCSHLEVSDFTEARLEKACFLFADLTKAVMSGTDMRDGRFKAVSLKEAFFDETEVGNAEFDQVDLSGAHLNRARHLDTAVFRDVIADARTAWPNLADPYPAGVTINDPGPAGER
jgi:Pentapeptide repeats (8 copies)